MLACPVFIPELTHVGDEAVDGQYFFAYSVRFALLGEEAQAAQRGVAAPPPGRGALDRVQLRGRHWVIRGAEGQVQSEVRGEAVIGQYPLLEAGAHGHLFCCIFWEGIFAAEEEVGRASSPQPQSNPAVLSQQCPDVRPGPALQERPPLPMPAARTSATCGAAWRASLALWRARWRRRVVSSTCGAPPFGSTCPTSYSDTLLSCRLLPQSGLSAAGCLKSC